MSADPKPTGTGSGQPETPMGQMKVVWKRLSEEARDYWQEQFSSSRKLSELRAELATKFKIQFKADARLSEFKNWVFDQDRRDAQAERMQENERRLISQHPDWSLDRVREEVLRQSYFETLASGDFKLGLKTVKADQNERILDLDRQKFEFDAAKACLAKLPELKAISEKPKLSEEEKTKAIQQILFNR